MTERISQLIYRRLLGAITPEELAELQCWIDKHPDNALFVRSLTDPESMDRDLKAARSIDSGRPAEDMRRRIKALRSRHRLRVAAVAASVSLIVATCTYLLVTYIGNPATPIETLASSDHLETLDDIVAGATRATLSSSNGEAIRLSAPQSGQDTRAIASTSSASHSTAHRPDTIHYCLDVPRGGEFKIVLEDSTEVWLNSQSQLRYPATFAAGERRVQLTGEAYMHVKSDPSRPFYVESRGQEVRVYGTTFNIKAYEDENLTYTTLETGSISLRPLSGHGGELILSPGHQALFDSHNDKVDMRVVKPEVITGWRNGRFVFEEQKLESIMRDLSRWYDFDYEFADTKAREIVFLGSIPRYADFTTAIAILESSGGLKFTLADNKVVISTSHQ